MHPEVMEFMKDLTDSNLKQKVKELLFGISNNFATGIQIEIMFMLYNRIYKDRPEHTKTCSSCRERVYNRLKEYLNENR